MPDLEDLADRLTLTTPRLALRPYTATSAQAVLDGDRGGQNWSPGFPRDDDRDIARMIVETPPGDEGALRFGARQMIDRETGVVVGALGNFGPPSPDGVLLIGYGVAPEVEGRGLTTEAVRALIEFGLEHASVMRITGQTETTNIGSQRVMEKAGMSRVSSGGSLYDYEITRAS